jgi:hypothetical protein
MKQYLIDAVANNVYDDVRQVLISGLKGIRSENSFDFNKVDYIIPDDNLYYRTTQITRQIIYIVAPILEKLIVEEITNNVRTEMKDIINKSLDQFNKNVENT